MRLEGWVGAGESQRRPGLHVDSPGEVKIKNEAFEKLIEGQGDSQAYGGHHWGLGCCHYIPHLPHTAGRTTPEADEDGSLDSAATATEPTADVTPAAETTPEPSTVPEGSTNFQKCSI